MLLIPQMGVKSKFDDRWEEGRRVIGIVGPVNVKIQHVDEKLELYKLTDCNLTSSVK